MRRASKIALGVLGAFVLMQAVRFPHENPPATGPMQAPADVAPLLRRACYDCHSHETRWPWYSQIAPVSWLLQRDVTEGRKHLDFSTWGALTPDRRARKQRGCGKQVEQGEMPLWFYVPLHPEAKLSAEEKAKLVEWARGPVAEPAH